MSHRSALAQLRAQRASGKTRLDTYQVEDLGAIYDEVDEDGYKKVVRSRLDKDDFVVDDNGEGYADDGREEWQNERVNYSSDDDETLKPRSKAAKRKREEDREKEDKSSNKILNYFNNGPVVAPKPKVSLHPFHKLSNANPSSYKPLPKMRPSWPTYSAKSTPISFRREISPNNPSNQNLVAKSEFSPLLLPATYLDRNIKSNWPIRPSLKQLWKKTIISLLWEMTTPS